MPGAESGLRPASGGQNAAKRSSCLRPKDMIHASRLSTALQCLKKALKQLSHPMEPVLSPDKEEYTAALEELLEPLGLTSGRRNDPTARSLEILEAHSCGRNLRFQHQRLRTTIPLLFEREDGRYKAVYPVCSTAPKDSMLPLLYINRLIASACGVEIAEHEFLYLKKEARRQPDSRPSDFFALSDRLKKTHGGWNRQSADEMLDSMSGWISDADLETLAMEAFSIDESELVPRRVRACSSPSRCPYYNECWKEDSMPDTSALLLTNSARRTDLELDGIYSLDQIDGSHFEGNPLQYAQIQAARKPDLFLDRPAVECWMETLQSPISYLDFEWETFALPPYERMQPFDVLCFQYSLHVETEDGSLAHSSFFSTGDCRRAFIEHLLADLPESGSIMVFNMEGAEKLRLMQLADQFEEYRQPLEAVCERMVDLSLPFENGACYLLAQRGKSSLKTLLPLFSDHNGYQDLDVHNGMEAVFAYRKARHSRDEDEVKRLGEQISDYCAMDTYAERELFLGLRRLLADAAAKPDPSE